MEKPEEEKTGEVDCEWWSYWMGVDIAHEKRPEHRILGVATVLDREEVSTVSDGGDVDRLLTFLIFPGFGQQFIQGAKSVDFHLEVHHITMQTLCLTIGKSSFPQQRLLLF